MTSKGYPTGRATNLARATLEAKKKYLETVDWYTTKEYMKNWLRANMALSRPTISDYLATIESRLRKDPQVQAMKRPTGFEDIPEIDED